jgi:hypothetical protein
VETRRDGQCSRCAGANSPSEGQRAKSNHQTLADMRKVLETINHGTGVMCMTKTEAGEAYRAAKRKKMEFTSFFTRKRVKGTK